MIPYPLEAYPMSKYIFLGGSDVLYNRSLSRSIDILIMTSWLVFRGVCSKRTWPYCTFLACGWESKSINFKQLLSGLWNHCLGGGFKYVLFSPLFGEDSNFWLIVFNWVETSLFFAHEPFPFGPQNPAWAPVVNILWITILHVIRNWFARWHVTVDGRNGASVEILRIWNPHKWEILHVNGRIFLLFPPSSWFSGKWRSIWKVTILLEIHPFLTEPWLWEDFCFFFPSTVIRTILTGASPFCHTPGIRALYTWRLPGREPLSSQYGCKWWHSNL